MSLTRFAQDLMCPRPRIARSRRRRHAPRPEALEDRRLPANFFVSSSGANPAAIQSAINTYRITLSGEASPGVPNPANPNNPGSLQQGRREINWDGVPDASASPNAFPADFFNAATAGRARGAVFSTAATPADQFEVSASAASGTPVRFGNIDPSYTAQFQTFSAERLFTPIGTNVMDVTFFVPGTTTPANVTGFGAVFTDVDVDGSTTMEYFDANGTSLGVFNVPASPIGGLSFLGVGCGVTPATADVAGIARVRITAGDAALAPGVLDVSDGGTADLVAMDDFIYGEPQTAPTFDFAAAAVSVNESAGTATVTINRTGGLTQPLTVDVNVAGGTATPGADFTAPAATVSFAAGQMSQTVTIPIVNDALYENDETIDLTLTNPSTGGQLGAQTTATVTIVNDDAPPSFSIDNVTIVEGDGGTKDAVFTVTKSGATALPATVAFSTADGTATAGQDYTATSGTLTFAPGDTSMTIAVPVQGDLLDEPDETFFVNLSNPTDATIAAGQGIGTILDNDPPPALSIGDVQVVEGDSGTTNAVFTVFLNTPSGLTVTVDYATADGTATAPADYTSTNGTLTFAPGATSQTFSVPVVGDTIQEGDETFFATLSNATNATITHAQGLATILDDDSPVVAQGATIAAVEGSSITGLVATFTDPNGALAVTSYDATIDWGDGTMSTAGTITEAGNTFSVNGTHTYTTEGTYPITTTIVRSGTSTAIAHGQAVVNDGPLTPGGAVMITRPTVGTPVLDEVVGAFIDQGGTDDLGNYHVSINWGDGSPPSTGTITGFNLIMTPNGLRPEYTVAGAHTFASPGTYHGSVQVTTTGGASVLVPFDIMAVAPVLTCQSVSATEDVTLNNVALAEISASGSPPPVFSNYTAAIDWGDGTAPTAGFIDASGAVLGSHTYAESGNYPIRVTLGTADNPNVVTQTCNQSVADVPINLTAMLDPASDTGISNSDGITKDNTPTYYGQSEAGSVVRIYRVNGLDRQLVGAGVTQASGLWTATVNAPLADGTYGNLIAEATDRNGVTQATVMLPTLVVDTVGPKVNDLTFDRINGQLFLTFQDDRSGLDQTSLVDGANYSFTGRSLHSHQSRFLINSLDATAANAPTDPQVVTATINGGRPIRGGMYTLTVRSGGVQDVAGNALDGEFYGYFPSGNNQPGGDFVVLLDARHNITFAPSPQYSYATPLNPPGTPGTAFRITPGGGLTPAGRQQASARLRQIQRQQRLAAIQAKRHDARQEALTRLQSARKASLLG